MANFRINADEVLEECENKLKLTLQPDEGHRTARSKQKQISEWRAAARNYKEKQYVTTASDSSEASAAGLKTKTQPNTPNTTPNTPNTTYK